MAKKGTKTGEKRQKSTQNREKGAILKKRNWTFVLYPESAPKNWRELLQKSGIQAAVSPLHNRDVNPTGEVKKEHYHIILVYPGPTTYNAVAGFTASLNATIPQVLEAVKGMWRYFTHKDNPEKAQYEEREITTVNGFNISDLVELTKSEVNELKRSICNLIREVDITEYAGLLDFLCDNELWAEYDVAANNTLFFNTYLTSRRHAELMAVQNLGKIELSRAKARAKAAEQETQGCKSREK